MPGFNESMQHFQHIEIGYSWQKEELFITVHRDFLTTGGAYFLIRPNGP